MRNDSPVVSIGVPTFNRAQSLSKCLNSILQQSYKNIELIVSDNASSDETPEVIQRFKNHDSRMISFRQDHNIEGVPNFEFVRKRASGTYFMLLGDDDWIDSRLIQSCVGFLEQNPDHVGAGGRTMYYRENNATFEGISHQITANKSDERILGMISQLVDAGPFWGGLYRRNCLLGIPFIEAWGVDYYYLCETVYHGKYKTLPDVFCHRADNSYLEDIQTRLTRGGIVDGQGLDPYGIIASIMFWRIVTNGDAFETMEFNERLLLAAKFVEITGSRWTITGETDLLSITNSILNDQDIYSEYYDLRSWLVSEWLMRADSGATIETAVADSILKSFILLGYVSIKPLHEEENGLHRLVRKAAIIKAPKIKYSAIRIMSLFY
jgi:glycosyltransferase involved in cell wall biosynthesis